MPCECSSAGSRFNCGLPSAVSTQETRETSSVGQTETDKNAETAVKQRFKQQATDSYGQPMNSSCTIARGSVFMEDAEKKVYESQNDFAPMTQSII
jgi:NAD(P)-dependent dehydrogenase (short-subunit alcohol dehydrogenase family)